MASAIKNVGRGTNQILFFNKRTNPPIRFTLPVNPESIKWDGELVHQMHDVRGGYHYQFIKYRRTNGKLAINTGAARNTPFANEFFKAGNVNSAYEYMMRFGSIIEYWMKETVRENVGPITMVDNYFPRPIKMDIVFTGFPAFGPEAAHQSYQFTVPFQIISDYQDRYDVSAVKQDVLPPLARAQDVSYVSKSGDTVFELAEKFYGSRKFAALIIRVARNDPFIDDKGNIKAGARLIIPYAPLPREYRAVSPNYDGIKDIKKAPLDLSKPVGDLLANAGSFFNFLDWFD